MARRPDYAAQDRQGGFKVRVSGRLRSDDGKDRATASGGRNDQGTGGPAYARGVSYAQIPEGLHAHFGASAPVAPRTDRRRDWPRTARRRGMVVTRPGSKARDTLRQTSRLGASRESSCTANSAGRAVGCLGRWPGATAIAEAHDNLGVTKRVRMDH